MSRFLLQTFVGSAAIAACAIGCTTAPANDEPVGTAEQAIHPRVAAIPVCASLDLEALDHACLHGNFGPFRAVDAVPLTQPASSNISRRHTSHIVRLVRDLPSGHEGAVDFKPVETGEYAFYLGAPNVPLRLIDTTTQADVDIECTHPVTNEQCGKVRRVFLTELVGGRTYRVELGPIGAQWGHNVRVIVEQVEHDHGDEG